MATDTEIKENKNPATQNYQIAGNKSIIKVHDDNYK